jgi:hypothetical protein
MSVDLREHLRKIDPLPLLHVSRSYPVMIEP